MRKFRISHPHPTRIGPLGAWSTFVLLAASHSLSLSLCFTRYPNHNPNPNLPARYVVHVGSLAPGTGPLAVGDAVAVSVDYARRGYIAPNHTMTHVLNHALKTVLLGDKPAEGVTIDQKGSLVDAEKLRFDFTWSGALNATQVRPI